MYSPPEITFYSHKHYMEIWSLTFTASVPPCVHTNVSLELDLTELLFLPFKN